MAELPIFSSPGSHYDQHQILLDQENELSPSPLRAQRGGKPKGLPTVTPKRFTKFFTPRVTLSAHGGRQSKAGRQLRDITKSGANRRRTLGGDVFSDPGGDEHASRPAKRRKHSFDILSSPPQSSPLKRVQVPEHGHLHEVLLSPSLIDDDDDLPDLFDELQPFPQPIWRLRPTGHSRRILERSFGGYDALDRGRRGYDHGAEWRTETANFISTPADRHAFRGKALPFCTASCNTNSLVAFGDEEGGLRLIDSASTSSFSKPYIHFRPHRNAIMDLNFSADDFLLASASGDQTVRIIDMHTQKSVCVLSGHTSSVKQVRFQPDDEKILSTSSRDGTVQVWDLRCSATGSVSSLRTVFARDAADDAYELVRFSKNIIRVGPAHRSVTTKNGKGSVILNSEDTAVSVTAIEHLRNGRGHLLLTASELSGSIKLWDLRSTSRNHIPVSSTALPESHHKTRNFGINALAISGDGSRLYSVCRDATVYAYSTNHLILGCPPELSASRPYRRSKQPQSSGIGPLYGFRHPAFKTGSFYIKGSLRRARGDKSEMLAVGSSDHGPVLFPTDERHMQRPEIHPEDDEEEAGDIDLPTMPPPKTAATPKLFETSFPISANGTALVRGHTKEVTSLSWTHDGDLVSISDDFTALCWREDAEKARDLRMSGERDGGRWNSGWAEVDAEWDEEEC